MRTWLARMMLKAVTLLVGDAEEVDEITPVCALCGREAEPHVIHLLADFWELGFLHHGEFIHAPLCPTCVHKRGRLTSSNVVAVGTKRRLQG